ncbi:uncharacterized protein YktB (UPF0637 family) [Planomicrobium koreense]|uniref:UPF0637 protein HNQ44_000453 n=1 Tax=Planococcus koreensis TaxID=112331 RepID=A0A7W8CP73_9BACL|nr:DUF1054 domain-containing protein [Planococcus koreensis]MBB5179031.1 uncharacterized protein YktB (UPF0637 family) [Planococcus koreensis]
MAYWNQQDFEVFETPGLERRMEALIAHVRPKFEELGKDYSSFFSGKTGEEFYPHVAKHMRRTVNPPNDSWVAFAPHKRGYKAVPHFQIGLWNSHVFVILAVIYEASGKSAMAERLLASNALEALPKDFMLSGDHMKPEASDLDELSSDGIDRLLVRLRDVKKGELVIGRHITREEAVQMSTEEFHAAVEDTFSQLLPIYDILLNKTKVPQR